MATNAVNDDNPSYFFVLLEAIFTNVAWRTLHAQFI